MHGARIRGWMVASWVLWTAGAAIILTAFGLRDANLGDVGVGMLGAAVTLTIWGFFVKQRRIMGIVYQLGKDAGREEAEARLMG